MSLSKPSLTEDSWVDVPSHRRRRHWEVMRKVVMCRSIENIGAMLQRVRHSRRACGWRPCREMELAAALQDVRELLYHLVEENVHSDMLLWALDRAAGGPVEASLRQRVERQHNPGCCGAPPSAGAGARVYKAGRGEGRHRRRLLLLGGGDFCRHTEWLCSKVVYDFCITPLH
jgi:hypothetical protein